MQEDKDELQWKLWIAIAKIEKLERGHPSLSLLASRWGSCGICWGYCIVEAVHHKEYGSKYWVVEVQIKLEFISEKNKSSKAFVCMNYFHLNIFLTNAAPKAIGTACGDGFYRFQFCVQFEFSKILVPGIITLRL